MGKYMRKNKIAGEVAVMELAQTSLGVRTRAKTLALQRLQNSTVTGTTTTTNSGSSYLQLRSRRLEKPPLGGHSNETKKQPKESFKENPNSNPANPNPNPSPSPNPRSRTSSRLAVASVNSGSVGSVSLSYSKKEDGFLRKGNDEPLEPLQENNFNDVGFEASFGENVLEIEPRDRTTRETTPCSLIRGSETLGTPGSTTRPTNSSATNRRIHNTVGRNIPTAHEMEDFFTGPEQQQQRIFTEKYNFDPSTDSPLPGRYEWERVDP